MLLKFQMASSVELLTPFNFHSWKGDMEIQLHARGLYTVTMDIEEEPSSVTYKAIFLNKKDEAFRFLCLSVSGSSFPSLEIEDSKGNLGQIGNPIWKVG